MIKEVAEEYDLNWVMLTAVAAQESRFNPSSVSWAGAVGIMQVLPRFSEISSDSLYIPEVNIREGAKILSSHLKHYSYMDSTNQWKFALAAYNVGQGHLADARRLTIDHNEDPNEWDPVSESLLKLMQRKYYQNARYGFCRGIETVKYVNEITNRYNTYQSILAYNENRYKTGLGVFGLQTLN
jgi:membrane-bound lytic murein transglycosylase F